MENKVNLYGASGHSKVIADILLSNNVLIEKIIDDNPKIETILGIKVYKNTNSDFDENSNWIISIGNNKVRKMLSAKLNLCFSTAIHKNAVISNYSTLDEGTVVMAGAIINPDVKVGKHCIINTNAVIEHDCVLEDFVHISPNASLAGGVTIGEGSHVGIGATIIQGVSVGKWVTIGAGTVILKDVPNFVTIVGNPGRIIKNTQENE